MRSPSRAGGVDVPHDEIEECREEEGRGAQDIRELAAARVGDDPGRNLEDHLAEGEERVRGEGFRVVQPGVEQEDRVDPPDERRRQRREQGQDEIGSLDSARWVSHIDDAAPRTGRVAQASVVTRGPYTARAMLRRGTGQKVRSPNIQPGRSVLVVRGRTIGPRNGSFVNPQLQSTRAWPGPSGRTWSAPRSADQIGTTGHQAPRRPRSAGRRHVLSRTVGICES